MYRDAAHALARWRQRVEPARQNLGRVAGAELLACEPLDNPLYPTGAGQVEVGDVEDPQAALAVDPAAGTPAAASSAATSPSKRGRSTSSATKNQ